jgi:hypothetical protein
MIPKLPRNQIDLTGRNLKVWRTPDDTLVKKMEVIIAISTLPGTKELYSCLHSVSMQKCDWKGIGVVILQDQAYCKTAPSFKLPEQIVNRTWYLTANCGSAALSRNTILEYVETNIPEAEWVARLDYDDRFTSSDSLNAMIESASGNSCKCVIGSNRVMDSDYKCVKLNYATNALLNYSNVIDLLEKMSRGVAENELPSCNLLLATHSGLKYPEVSGAEDHWLVADLLINHYEDVTLLTEPFYTDYRINGFATQNRKSEERYFKDRLKLFNAAKTWAYVKSLPGEIIGLGLEGVVRLNQDKVHKHFYPGVISERKVEWLMNKLSKCEPFTPRAEFFRDEMNKSWVACYQWESTKEMLPVSLEAINRFIVFQLAEKLVCTNVKSSNFRRRNDGGLVYIDIGNSIIPMDISFFRDASARMYSIGVLGNSDQELRRRKVNADLPEVWEALEGFSEFCHKCIKQYTDSQWDKNPEQQLVGSLNRNKLVALLIKACPMDAEYVSAQIFHIVKQLSYPQFFEKVILLIDSFEGPYLREHSKGNLHKLIAEAEYCKDSGVIDEILFAPTDFDVIRETNFKWFAISCPYSHTNSDAPVTPQVWGFDQINTKYVLQCDVDILIGRRNWNHDYLKDMLTACEPEDITGIAFNIPHGKANFFSVYDAPSGEFVPEIRCGLLDLNRIKNFLPLPNSLINNHLELSWHRSLKQYQQYNGLRTLRGGDPATFYIHPPNERKGNLGELSHIREVISHGFVPKNQLEQWDLKTTVEEWTFPTRSEDVIVLALGYNTDVNKLTRFANSLKIQSNQEFGLIFIDDGSSDLALNEVPGILTWLGSRLTLIRNSNRIGHIRNIIKAIKNYCDNPESLIVILDQDDAFISDEVVERLTDLTNKGHDLILAGPFRPDKPTKVYYPEFDEPKQKFGGDVWIHLRSFKKRLFDQVSEDFYKINDEWITICTDYATMIPMAEIAQNPIYIPEYWYWHEKSTIKDENYCQLRDQTIESILSHKRNTSKFNQVVK